MKTIQNRAFWMFIFALASCVAKAKNTDSPPLSEVNAADYLELSPLDTLPGGLMEWSKESAHSLYLGANDSPYTYLAGKVAPGVELAFEDQYIPIDKNSGEFRFQAPFKYHTAILHFRITEPNGEASHFRLLYSWRKLPPFPNARFDHSAFAQLYSGNNMTSIVDLDAQEYARLTFRLYAPPPREQAYDAWELSVLRADGTPAAQLKRQGSPPVFVRWSELGLTTLERGHYQYQITLYLREREGNRKFDGPPNSFHAMEGKTVVRHSFLPRVVFEPRGELGYFHFENDRGLDYDNQFISADISVLFFRRLLLKGMGMASIHSGNPTCSLSIARGGIGVRFAGDGYSRLGRPYLFKVDALATYTTFTVSPDSSVRRFSTIGILLEPHLVLWKHHYFTSSLEVASSPAFTYQRVSMGLGYEFYIRPWALRLGMNIAYDWLLRYSPRDDLAFRIFRTGASFTFML